MTVSFEAFFIRLLIAAVAYFFGDMVINKMVKKAEAKTLFEIILVVGCIAYIIFGAFLPHIG